MFNKPSFVTHSVTHSHQGYYNTDVPGKLATFYSSGFSNNKARDASFNPEKETVNSVPLIQGVQLKSGPLTKL
jgi:hypothetical protein